MRTENDGRSDEPSIRPCGGDGRHRGHGVRFVGRGTDRAQAQSKTQANQQKDVQVIAFQQTWNTIAKECTNTYGPEGVAYVEVSPPQESIPRHAVVDELSAGKLQT